MKELLITRSSSRGFPSFKINLLIYTVWQWLWTILKVNLKACWIWNDRYNKALTDPISWRLAFADCRFFPNFVRLFDRNLCFTGFSARRAYLKSIFLSMPCDSMRQKMFSCDFLRFVDICFHFVYISRCVTHSVQRVLVKISFHTSVLICKAETSLFVNKVPVLSCSISDFSMWNIPRSILGG